MCLFCQTGFVASSTAEGRAEGWSRMAWALVPWNAKELMPVTDGADSAGATCLGKSRPRPAVLLLNVASRCGFNCISNANFVEQLVMQVAMYTSCGTQHVAFQHASVSSIEPDSVAKRLLCHVHVLFVNQSRS